MMRKECKWETRSYPRGMSLITALVWILIYGFGSAHVINSTGTAAGPFNAEDPSTGGEETINFLIPGYALFFKPGH